MRLFLCLLAAGFLALSFPVEAQAAAKSITSLVYFTGVGCPHCAKTDPVLLKYKVREGNLLVVEYEIYQDAENAILQLTYDDNFGTGFGVPMIVAGTGKDETVVGDTPILRALDRLIATHKGNRVVLPTGSVPFDKLKLSDLPRLPKIWFKNRIAIRKHKASGESDTIKKFLIDGVVPAGCAPVQAMPVALSDDMVNFRKACAFGGWMLMSD